jgi:hypothetical protein
MGPNRAFEMSSDGRETNEDKIYVFGFELFGEVGYA